MPYSIARKVGIRSNRHCYAQRNHENNILSLSANEYFTIPTTLATKIIGIQSRSLAFDSGFSTGIFLHS